MTRRSGAPWIGLQRLAVHRPHEQVVLVHQLLDRHAARQGALGWDRPTDAGRRRSWPLKTADGLTPAARSTSASRTPVHSAQPAPPLVHWLPRACGDEERAAVAAALEHHAAASPGGTVFLSSPSVISSGLLTSPSMVSFQASGSLVASGHLAVVADEELGRRRRVVVEQLLGRLRHQRLVAEHDQAAVLAGELQQLRTLAWRCGAPARPSWPPAPSAAGISPPGIAAPNTIGPPTAALMAARPEPPRKPRRDTSVRRPNTTASARSGSS